MAKHLLAAGNVLRNAIARRMSPRLSPSRSGSPSTHLLQDSYRGRRGDLAAEDDMLLGRILDEVVADAADAGYEKHAGWYVAGDELRIVRGPTRHAHPPPGRHGFGLIRQMFLQSPVHSHRF